MRLEVQESSMYSKTIPFTARFATYSRKKVSQEADLDIKVPNENTPAGCPHLLWKTFLSYP